MGVEHIRRNYFYKKYNVVNIDLVKLGLFKWSDLEDLRRVENSIGISARIIKIFLYLTFSVRHPRFFISFVVSKSISFVKFKLNTKKSKSIKQRKQLKNIHPISNCILKASIAASFKPKRILEIGTYLGWGAASFKKACPSALVYTVNPSVDTDSNNPIDAKRVGEFCKKKKLKVMQIWSDSTKYDYSKLPEVDVTYIDGNHKYSYVYKDLENASKMTKKCIILDDYIPEAEANKDNVVYGPWNDGVVGAVNDFLKDNNVFRRAYWIEGTQLCVLIK